MLADTNNKDIEWTLLRQTITKILIGQAKNFRTYSYPKGSWLTHHLKPLFSIVSW